MPVSIEHISLPSPSAGTLRQIEVRRFGQSESRPHIYIQTGLHADEIPGLLVQHHLDHLLRQASEKEQIKGQITLVPFANPIGMAQRLQGNVIGRLELNTGKNFNRYYADLNATVKKLVESELTNNEDENTGLIRKAIQKAISELSERTESDAMRKILMSLSSEADICIDLHCDTEAILHMYSGYAMPEAVQALSDQLGCHALLLAENSGGSPFDESISEIWRYLQRSIPHRPIADGYMGCTVELRGQADVDDALALSDAQNLYQFLVNQDVIKGEKVAPKITTQATPLDGVCYVEAPHAGVVAFQKEPGDRVFKGDILGYVVRPEKQGEEARSVIKSDIDGLIFSRERQRLVASGQIVFGIAGKESISSRAGQPLLSD